MRIINGHFLKQKNLNYNFNYNNNSIELYVFNNDEFDFSCTIYPEYTVLNKNQMYWQFFCEILGRKFIANLQRRSLIDYGLFAMGNVIPTNEGFSIFKNNKYVKFKSSDISRLYKPYEIKDIAYTSDSLNLAFYDDDKWFGIYASYDLYSNNAVRKLNNPIKNISVSTKGKYVGLISKNSNWIYILNGENLKTLKRFNLGFMAESSVFLKDNEEEIIVIGSGNILQFNLEEFK